jgi:hypothetical protein
MIRIGICCPFKVTDCPWFSSGAAKSFRKGFSSKLWRVRLVTFDELDRLLDKTEALVKYEQTKAEASALREKVKNLQEQLLKYKNVRVTFASNEISLEAFEQKVSEETLKVYGEEIARRVNHTLETRSRWPEWFRRSVERQIQDGIKKGLDGIFDERVQTAVDNAKQAEWPRFLQEYTRKKITPLCKQFIINQLSNPITLKKTCDKCGTATICDLNPYNIAELIKRPHIMANCPNKECKDFFIRHRIPLTLGDVMMHLAGTDKIPVNFK